jgi:hypothetical protein
MAIDFTAGPVHDREGTWFIAVNRKKRLPGSLPRREL